MNLGARVACSSAIVSCLARKLHHGIFWMRPCSLFLVTAVGLASAAFTYLGTGLHPIWWLLWLAPIPVLAIAPRLRGRAAFLLGAIAWFLGEMNQWNYVRHEMELPPPITILYFVVPAVIFGFGVLFVRSFLRRGPWRPRPAESAR